MIFVFFPRFSKNTKIFGKGKTLVKLKTTRPYESFILHIGDFIKQPGRLYLVQGFCVILTISNKLGLHETMWGLV